MVLQGMILNTQKWIMCFNELSYIWKYFFKSRLLTRFHSTNSLNYNAFVVILQLLIKPTKISQTHRIHWIQGLSMNTRNFFHMLASILKSERLANKQLLKTKQVEVVQKKGCFYGAFINMVGSSFHRLISCGSLRQYFSHFVTETYFYLITCNESSSFWKYALTYVNLNS